MVTLLPANNKKNSHYIMGSPIDRVYRCQLDYHMVFILTPKISFP